MNKDQITIKNKNGILDFKALVPGDMFYYANASTFMKIESEKDSKSQIVYNAIELSTARKVKIESDDCPYLRLVKSIEITLV